MKKILLYLLLAMAWWSHQLVAQEAGWIDHFAGKAEDYQLKRGEQTLPVALLTIVNVGDTIVVNDKQQPLELSLRGGTLAVKVTAENSPFVINSDNQVPAELTELWTWSKQRFEQWRKLTQTSKNTEGAEEEPMFTMPLLANTQSTATLVAGEHLLHLQWYGNNPPYQVLLKQSRKKLFSTTSATTELSLPPLTFEPNKSYRIEITDAANSKPIMAGFRAEDSKKVPPYSDTLKLDVLTESTRALLKAIWLTEQKDKKAAKTKPITTAEPTTEPTSTKKEEPELLAGKWAFEAYQQLVKLDNYLPAKLLKDALVRGMGNEVKRGIRG